MPQPPLNRKLLKLTLYGIILIIPLLLMVLNQFFNNDIGQSRYANLKDLLQNKYHGIAINHTQHPLKITDYRYISVLQPGQNSVETGVYDVDSVIIEQPLNIDDKIYTQGVFKFCDFARIKIERHNDIDTVMPSKGAILCKMLHDYAVYPNIPSAFPYNHEEQ